MCAFLGLPESFDRVVFLRVDCECNRPSFLTIVFSRANVFNGDLNKWDVSEVADMAYSKLIRIAWNLCCCDRRVLSGVRLGGHDVM